MTPKGLLAKPQRGKNSGLGWYFTSMRFDLPLAQAIEVRAIQEGISYSEFVRQGVQMLVDRIPKPKGIKPQATAKPSKGAPPPGSKAAKKLRDKQAKRAALKKKIKNVDVKSVKKAAKKAESKIKVKKPLPPKKAVQTKKKIEKKSAQKIDPKQTEPTSAENDAPEVKSA